MGQSVYLRLTDYNGRALTTSGTYDNSVNINNNIIDVNNPQFLRIDSYSSNVEQTLNIGSQATGAGAGKITFNPMMITKQADATSPILFQMAASGTPYKTAEVYFVNQSNLIMIKYTYKLVAVKTVSWASDGESGSVIEAVSFEYGGLTMSTNIQNPDGRLTPATQSGWNRVRNVLDNDPAIMIK